MTKKDYQWIYGALVATVLTMIFMLYAMSDYSPLYHPDDNFFPLEEATSSTILKFN